MKIYILQQRHYHYNDEYYIWEDGGVVELVFKNQIEARKACDKKNEEFLRSGTWSGFQHDLYEFGTAMELYKLIPKLSIPTKNKYGTCHGFVDELLEFMKTCSEEDLTIISRFIDSEVEPYYVIEAEAKE